METQSNGVRIHFTQRGAGDVTLVFLHYYGGSSRTWDGVAEALTKDFRIVATDHRGWGKSDASAESYGIADLAADAEQVIHSLGLRRYILVGHSMGGKVAQLIASRQPDGLEGLVLVAPSPPSPMLLSEQERETLNGAYQTRESVEFVIDHVLTAKALPAALREQVIQDSLGGAPAAKSAWPNIAMREDISAAVTHLTVPTIVISGELDQVDRLSTLEAELLPRIPHAKLVVLPGTGHLSPLEAPAEVSRIIARFAASVSGGTVTCKTAEQIPAAFDAALNAGDLDSLLAVFSNHAMMRMTDGEIANTPATLRNALAKLLALRPQIHNRIRTVLRSGELALLLLDWSLTIQLPDGKAHTENGTATQVAEQNADGGWRLRISNPLGVA
ncbi:alpha/beta fold hydrolase [Caballeronia sp. ATUFL_M1_KS5A]|uniref:alpha/beta fold hydrolase n=1 Tax=Caballeronia sp. ATUFL_M1_KS5A TaxID=2921778 RepID=UPI0020290D17|nr:alpha/beta fold hydrolase [Caballeronia sp. ATUFL_M1_KS5A]